MCIQKINQEAQEKIKLILESCRKTHPYISQEWLADKLGMTRSTLNFQITLAANFSLGLYEEIIHVLRKEGVIKDPTEALRSLHNSLMEVQTSVFHQLELLTLSVKKVGHDGKYEDHERPLIKNEIESIRQAMNDLFDKMVKDIS